MLSKICSKIERPFMDSLLTQSHSTTVGLLLDHSRLKAFTPPFFFVENPTVFICDMDDTGQTPR